MKENVQSKMAANSKTASKLFLSIPSLKTYKIKLCRMFNEKKLYDCVALYNFSF